MLKLTIFPYILLAANLFSLAEREYDTKTVQKYKKFLGFSEPNISYIDLFSSVAI